MMRSLRIALAAMIAIPLVWISFNALTAQAPPRHRGPAWDEAGALVFQPGGPLGPGPRGSDDRRPPRDDGFGPPDGGFRGDGPPGPRGDGPPGGRGDGPPPPRREGPPPPHAGGGEGHPPHPGPGGRGSLEHLRQIDPEMAELVERDDKLEQETYQLAAAYRRAAGDRRAEIKASLEEVVKEHFEARQNRRKLELKRLEDELTRLRGSIESRATARDEIVERRIAEVLGEDELKF